MRHDRTAPPRPAIHGPAILHDTFLLLALAVLLGVLALGLVSGLVGFGLWLLK